MDKFLEANLCDRCGVELKIRQMSKMNTDTLCPDCIEAEKKHPYYQKAVEAELAAVKSGNYNYEGLYAGRKYPFGEFCSEKDCWINMKEMLISIDNGEEKLLLCPNHAIMYAVGVVTEEMLTKRYPSETNKTQVCEVCGKAAVLYKEDGKEICLCEQHFDRLLKHNLEPEAFKVLYAKLGDLYSLHDDFYNPETGEALQPVE